MRQPEQPAGVWQPPGWSPQGAVRFLHGLVAPAADGADPVLAEWAAGRPDGAWAEWLRGQGIAAYTHHRLRGAGLLAALPAELAQALRGAYYLAAADAELHTRELREVLAALSAGGVTPVLFKGAALAHLAYPDPACRPMGDLDLWVSAEAMPRARDLLIGLGYALHEKAERPAALQAQQDGEVQLVGRRPGSGLVELHWGTFAGEWLRRTAAVDNAGILRRCRPVTVAGEAAQVMAAEDAAIQLAVHLAVNHQMAYPGVRGLLDVALLARAEAVDWTVVAQRSRAWRVATATWLVLQVTDELLGLPEARSAIAALTPSALRRRLLARFTGPDEVLAGKDITGGPRRLLYQLLLVDRPRDAVRLVGRTLWPEPAWLDVRYGASGAGVRLRHLGRALRGRL